VHTLYSSPSSPYARKVRVALHELGATDRVAVRDVDTRDPGSGLWDASPAGRLPVLVTAEGALVHDSPVIVAWVDATFGRDGSRVIPEGPARWDALTREATADGLLDTLVPWRMEVLRPEGERSPAFLEKSLDRTLRILGQMEREVADPGRVDVGTIATACALGYLEFRFAHVAWRGAHPRLAAWFDGFAARPSLRATRPHNLGEPPPS
jgi:glutathione S-transferase